MEEVPLPREHYCHLDREVIIFTIVTWNFKKPFMRMLYKMFLIGTSGFFPHPSLPLISTFVSLLLALIGWQALVFVPPHSSVFQLMSLTFRRMSIMELNVAIYVKLIGNYGVHRSSGFAHHHQVTSLCAPCGISERFVA